MRSYQRESISSTHDYLYAPKLVFIALGLDTRITLVLNNDVAVGGDVVQRRWFVAARPLARTGIPPRDIDAMSRDLCDIIHHAAHSSPRRVERHLFSISFPPPTL